MLLTVVIRVVSQFENGCPTKPLSTLRIHKITLCPLRLCGKLRHHRDSLHHENSIEMPALICVRASVAYIQEIKTIFQTETLPETGHKAIGNRQ